MRYRTFDQSLNKFKFRESDSFKAQFEMTFNKPFVEVDHDKQLLAELQKMVENGKDEPKNQ